MRNTDKADMSLATLLLPLRLHPGDDLRRALVQAVAQRGDVAAFVVSGIGSLVDARIRLAGDSAETSIEGPFEIVSLGGSVTASGAHLHMAVSDSRGRVVGGHVCFGNIVLTTVETVLAFVPGFDLSREPDKQTGFDELVIRSRGQ